MAIFWGYVIFVAFPFLAANQPPNEATSEWKYAYAPLHYAMIFYPAYLAYFMFVADNITRVRHIRKLIYPLCFITLFAATHMVFFIYGMVILWFSLITVPLGLLTLLAVEILAVVLDRRDENGETAEESAEKTRKIFNIIGRAVVPAVLALLLFNRYMDITVYHPKTEKEQEEKRLLGCQKNTNVIKTAMDNVQIDMGKASLKEIADRYRSEFSKKEIYASILGQDYGIVEVHSGGNFAEWRFLSAHRDNSYDVRAVYSFYRSGECGKDNKNCYWNTGACAIYVDDRKMIGEN